jgi:hypothetical protein
MDPLAALAILGLGLAGLALFNGIVSMAHGGGAQSNRLMFRRVGWQALAVLAVLLGALTG